MANDNENNWTIMVYMAGDNNLSEEMITALTGIRNAMKITRADERINIVAVYDSAYPTVPTKHYHFTRKNSNKPLEKCEVKYKHPQIKRRNRTRDGGSDDPPEINYIIDFVRWGVENWKAKNYALILTGHSDGIIGKTIFRDSNPDKALNLKFLGNILKKSKRKLGKNKKFALIGFDSCLMNMAEVGYELRSIADVLVASEGDVPISGWSYNEILSEAINQINNDTDFSGKKFGKIFVDKFIDFSQNYNVGGRSVSISACDLNEIENLRTSINGLAKQFNTMLNASLDKDKSKITDADIILQKKLKNLIHNSHYYSQTVMFEQSVDVLDFVQTLSADCKSALKELDFYSGEKPKDTAFRGFIGNVEKIIKACSEISESVDKYVLAYGNSGAAYQFSSGVSLFFPWTLISLYVVYSRYGKLDFSDYYKGEWFKFIENFNLLTYRGIGEPLSKEGMDYLKWWKDNYLEWWKEVNKNVGGKNVGGKNVGGKNVGGKNVGGKNVGGKNVGGKNVGARNIESRTERDGFYQLFERFRNHPIEHNVVYKKIK